MLESTLLPLLSAITASASGLWDFLPAPWWPVAIFLLRSADQTAATVRVIIISHGYRRAAWLLGFLQAILFLLGVAGVLGQLDNLWNLLAFSSGYAAGSVLGVTLDGWLAPGHAVLRVVSRGRGAAVVEALRRAGRGVTEFAGTGRQGTVTVLLTAIPRRQVRATRTALLSVDPKAFITVEDVRVLRGGWIL